MIGTPTFSRHTCTHTVIHQDDHCKPEAPWSTWQFQKLSYKRKRRKEEKWCVMLKVTAAVYDWRNFKIQLNSNHYGMFLGELIKLRIGVPRKNIKAFLKLKKKKGKNVLLSVSSNINFPVHDSARNSWQGERTWLGAEIKTGLRTFQSIDWEPGGFSSPTLQKDIFEKEDQEGIVGQSSFKLL